MRIIFIVPLLMLVLVMGLPLSNSQGVPDWVKNTAGWWSSDAISETEFVNAIEFLVNVGIISVQGENKCVNDLLKYFDEDFKTEEGKFIPIDRNTGSPHNCQKIKYKNKI